VVSAVLVASIIYRTRRVTVTVDVAKVEKDIRDHLSAGASRARVEAYLDERHIHHSYLDQSPAEPEYSHIELALIPESSRTWLFRGDIQIVFRFDDQDKLTHYSVQEIFTGP